MRSGSSNWDTRKDQNFCLLTLVSNNWLFTFQEKKFWIALVIALMALLIVGLVVILCVMLIPDDSNSETIRSVILTGVKWLCLIKWEGDTGQGIERTTSNTEKNCTLDDKYTLFLLVVIKRHLYA